MNLDIHTMQCLFIGICIAIAFSTSLVAEKDGEDGLFLWALALCFNAVAYVIWLLQSVTHNIITIPLTEMTGSITYATFCLAICRFLRRKVPVWHFTVLPVFVFLSCLFLRHTPEIQIIVVKSVLLFQTVFLCHELIITRFPFHSRGRYLTLFGIGVTLTVNLLRILAAAKAQFHIQWGPSWQELTTIPFILIFFSAILASCGFILMTKERSDSILKSVAMRDRLTQCWNRIRIEEVAEQELARLHRYGYPVTLIIADIDYFKKVNDTWGHPAGDSVLRDFAEISRETLRTTDFIGRWGGEEFVAILPFSSFSEAYLLAERWRNAFSSHVCNHGEIVTASFGIATARSTDKWTDWLSRADDALYSAKEAGRNCCRFENIQITQESDTIPPRSFAQLNWSEDYKTGFPEIDLEHREIIGRINDLLKHGVDGSFHPKVQEIIDLTRAHFYTEGKLFEQYMDPVSAGTHRAMHSYLLQRAENILERTLRGEIEIETLFHFVTFELAAQHIMVDDMKLLVAHGIRNTDAG